jgi:hypothetical protein
MKHTMAYAGESVMKKKPSGTSTQGAADHHSGWVARRSGEYHGKTIDASMVRPSHNKMTRNEQQQNNNEDSESW